MSSFITPELLLNAYANGYFPMADSRDSAEIGWFSPDPRGILPLNGFHLPKKLKKTLISAPFEVKIDHSFAETMRFCAAPRPGHPDSWINEEIIALYSELQRLGFAHSVECWQDGACVGGLYGVSIGGAFFGESMFSRATDASKIALLYLVEILLQAEYTLLDTQYVNDHLLQFGAIEIPRDDYLEMLVRALSTAASPSSRFSTVSGKVIESGPRDFKLISSALTDKRT